MAAAKKAAKKHAGFSLLLADEDSLGYFCNRVPEPPRLLPPGVYGLSNATLDAPWPKLVQSRAEPAAGEEREHRVSPPAVEIWEPLRADDDSRLVLVGVSGARDLPPAFDAAQRPVGGLP